MGEDKKGSHHHDEEQPPRYGTFQGVVNHPPPAAVGFPQPVPPPGASGSPPPPQSEYYARGYQTVPGYAVAEGRPVRERRLPCCGCGFGWFFFIIGFFLAAIPWYFAAIILMCSRNIDPREKPGYVACTIAAPELQINSRRCNDHNGSYAPILMVDLGLFWKKGGETSREERLNSFIVVVAVLAAIATIFGLTRVT